MVVLPSIDFIQQKLITALHTDVYNVQIISLVTYSSYVSSWEHKDAVAQDILFLDADTYSPSTHKKQYSPVY
jgi:hypothetical protein